LRLKTTRKTTSGNEDQIETEPATATEQSPSGTLHIVRRLRRAFLSICRCGDATFSPYRLTTEQYSLMRAVQRDPGIRQVDVRDRIFAEPNTVTAMVSLLEARGILRRKPSPSDGRARLLYLTAHGQAVLKKLAEDWEPMRALLRKCFSGKAGEEALEILDMVYVAMEHERENLLKRAYVDHPPGPDFGKADGAGSGSGSHHPPRYPATPPAQPHENTRPRAGRKLRRS
jgi:DNA-binding MarR family transcriptional regulator